jgi:filamentous hemagglutinin family protein
MRKFYGHESAMRISDEAEREIRPAAFFVVSANFEYILERDCDRGCGDHGRLFAGIRRTIGLKLHDFIGQSRGTNQFYSFRQLNLVSGDVANFSVPDGVSNVIARVTGGASNIDGGINVPDASFYLINNQGVIFGPDASVNVGGVLVVTTADELKFSDGKIFTASPSGTDATLSTAAPSAFGFLSASLQSITINGSTLSTSNQEPITVVGGDVNVNGGGLQSSGGRITVASVASAGTVTVDPSNPSSGVSLSGFSAGGTVSLTNGSSISTDGNQGGEVVIRAGALAADSSTISAQTEGSGNGVGIDIAGTGDLSFNDTNVLSTALGSGSGGQLTLSAATLEVTNGSEVATTAFGSGNGGNLNVSVSGTLTYSMACSCISWASSCMASRYS